MSARLLLFLTTVFVGSIVGDPQILSLKNYVNGSSKTIDNVEDGANLYLASNDNADYFKNIQVTTGGSTHTLDEISSLNPDGTPKKIVLSGGLSITSTNANTITNTLTGYLYITTAKQAQDPLFNVYVITGTHHVSVNGVQSTTVILNTQLKTESGDSDQPQKTTYVTGIQQLSDAELMLQRGIPSAQYVTAGTTEMFFENPATVLNADKTGTRKFFDHVEPLQIGFDYWYITAIGPISLTLKNDYVGSHNYTTSAVNTTGVIVSSNNLFTEHVVNFQLDPTKPRTIGTYITSTVTRQVKVNFIFVDAAGTVNSQTFDNTNTNGVYMTDHLAAQKLIVNATDILPGSFSCQYYGFSTDVPSGTTPSPPVTQTSATTQSSSQTTATNQTPGAASSAATSTAAPNGGSTVTGITNSQAGSSTVAPSNSPSSTTVFTTTRSSRSLLITDVFLLFVLICSFLF